jgi:hypothetical protein
LFDAIGAANLNVGTSTATSIVVGRSGVTTNVLGNLQVNTAYILPTAVAGSEGMVIVAGLAGATSWKSPGGFTHTFGGVANQNEFWVSNGTFVTSAISSSPDQGNAFVVPIDCRLTRLTFNVIVGTTNFLIYKNEVSSVTIGPASGLSHLPVSPAISFAQGDRIALQQPNVGFRNATITCYFE